MSWAPGWYGWDPDSEDGAAWGPFTDSGQAKGHPDPFAPDDAEVRVFYISVSDTPRHRDWSNWARQAAIWVDGPDSEAARAARGEGLGVPADWQQHLREVAAEHEGICGQCGGGLDEEADVPFGFASAAEWQASELAKAHAEVERMRKELHRAACNVRALSRYSMMNNPFSAPLAALADKLDAMSRGDGAS